MGSRRTGTCWKRSCATTTSRGSPSAASRPKRSSRAKRSSRSRYRFEPGEHARVFIGKQVDEAVGTGSHVADAAEHALQHPLLLDHLLSVELEAHQHLILECANEEIALPAREPIALVERHA